MFDREPHLMATDTYEDITESLKALAAQTDANDLIRVDGFRLYDAISAFELGNPKMDTGASYVSEEQEFESLYAVDTPEKLVAIMDSLLCAEMAWQEGSTLIQTVLSNIRVQKVLIHLTELNNFNFDSRESLQILEYLESKLTVTSWEDVLDIYILAMFKACSLVIELVEKGQTVVAIEEDFHPSTANYYILQKTPVDIVTRLVDAAAKFSSKHSWINERLVIRSSWLHTLRQGVPKKVVHLDKTLEGLETYAKHTVDEAHAAAAAKLFTNGIQTRATSFCLARPLVTIPLDKAVERWRSLLEAIKGLSRVFTITKSSDLLGFFLVFASQRNLTLPRVILKSVVGAHDLLGLSDKTWALKDVLEVSFPQLDKNKVSKQAKELYDAFLAEAGFCYFDVINVFCQDRFRQREGLISCIAAWDSLQVSADALDNHLSKLGIGSSLMSGNGQRLNALEFSSWVYFRKLQLMVWVALMTFELELALPWEFPAMYWYTKQLCEQLGTQIARLKAYFEQHNLRAFQDGYNYLVALELEARCLTQICNAQYQLHLVLQNNGLTSPQPIMDDSRPDLTFLLRLQPFEYVGLPTLPSYAEYEQAVASISMDLALPTAKSSLSAARSILNTLGGFAPENKELKLLKRSIMGLVIAIASLEKKEAKKATIETKEFHWYFPVAQIE